MPFTSGIIYPPSLLVLLCDLEPPPWAAVALTSSAHTGRTCLSCKGGVLVPWELVLTIDKQTDPPPPHTHTNTAEAQSCNSFSEIIGGQPQECTELFEVVSFSKALGVEAVFRDPFIASSKPTS